VRRTPTQSSPSAKDTGPRKATIPWSEEEEEEVGDAGEVEEGLFSIVMGSFTFRLLAAAVVRLLMVGCFFVQF